MKYPIRFRLYLPRGRGFWEVTIHGTLMDLRQDRREAGPRWRKAIAFCQPFGGRIRSRSRRSHGRLVFHARQCGPGTVAHECAHAAFVEMTAGRGKRSIQPYAEETYVLLVERFVTEFWIAFYRRFPSGVFPNPFPNPKIQGA